MIEFLNKDPLSLTIKKLLHIPLFLIMLQGIEANVLTLTCSGVVDNFNFPKGTHTKTDDTLNISVDIKNQKLNNHDAVFNNKTNALTVDFNGKADLSHEIRFIPDTMTYATFSRDQSSSTMGKYTCKKISNPFHK